MASTMEPAGQLQQQLQLLPHLTATEAFVEAVIRAMNMQQPPIGDSSSSSSSNSRMRLVVSCALAVAATAIANATARRIAAVPDLVMSCCASMYPLKAGAAKPAARTQRVLPWDAKPSTFTRVLRFVLRLLRPRLQRSSVLRRILGPLFDLLELLERRAARGMHPDADADTTLHITVPEKCTNDYYGAKPNIVFADLVWYAMTHESVARRTAERLDGLEVVQDGESGAMELRPSMLGDEVVREYEHDGHRVFMVLTTDAGTTTLGTKVHTRSVKLSAAPLDAPFSAAAASHAPINAFIAHVHDLRGASLRDRVWKPVLNHWLDGAWKERRIPSRKRFEHVAMRAADKRALTADVEAFLGSEAVYGRMGLCWNRGYLLHGPPGCGKSSCVSAMACTYRLPVYSVNLREVGGDVELRSMFASLPERVMVVMEDVDCMTDAVLSSRGAAAPASTGNAAGKKTVSLSGLLNVLDGIETGGGRLLVMTTNHKDALDPALVRPGRCDVHLEVGYSTFEHVEFLTNLYLGEAAAASLDRAALDASFASANVTPAEVAGILLPLATTTLADASAGALPSRRRRRTTSQQLVELCDRIAAAVAEAKAAEEAKVAEAKAAEDKAAAVAAATAAITAATFAAAAATTAAAAADPSPKMRRSNSGGSSSSSSSSSSATSPATPPG
jgi:hypothetical protein